MNQKQSLGHHISVAYHVGDGILESKAFLGWLHHGSVRAKDDSIFTVSLVAAFGLERTVPVKYSRAFKVTGKGPRSEGSPTDDTKSHWLDLPSTSQHF